MVEKRIVVKTDLEKAKKDFEDLSGVIQRQEEFLANLKLRIAEAEASLKDLNFVQRQAREDTIKGLNEELKIETAELRKLKVESQGLTKVIKANTSARKAGQVKALEFNETLLKNRDITSGLNKITGGLSLQIQQFGKLFVSVGKGVRAASASLSLFQKALIATGIGALVVLVGTLAANWDKVTKALGGVTKEQEKQLEDAKKLVAAQEEQFKNVTGTEETLKRQGKTEREILDLKIQQTNETISALEAQLETQKQIKKEQIEIGNRNKFILEGILSFILSPLNSIIVAYNKLRNRDVPLLSTSIASAVFDTEKISEEADKSISETEKKLQELLNRRDGFLNKIQEKEDADAEKAKNKADKDAQDAIDAEIKRLESIDEIRERFRKLNQDREDQTFLEQAERQKERALAELEALNATEEQKAELIKYFNGVIADAKRKDIEAENQLIAESEEEKRRIREKTFDDAVKLAGEESRLGKAILVAKTILSAKENFLRIKDSVLNAQKAAKDATVDGTKASSNAATGLSETLKLGLPKAIPFLIAYAAQAASVISAVKQAVGKTKQVASSVGGGSGLSADIQAPTVTTSAPSFNIVGSSPQTQLATAIGQQEQQPVKAFVVAGEVTTAQSLDRNIIEESSLG
tara:strand:- start:1203 stop:3116 length:1914 start_codon:yes stop_codon:yes gene_type:complete